MRSDHAEFSELVVLYIAFGESFRWWTTEHTKTHSDRHTLAIQFGADASKERLSARPRFIYHPDR